MHIEGQVLSNILCTREAEIRNRNSVQFGSVRIGVERVIDGGGNVICPITQRRSSKELDYKLILEISYKINTPDESEYYLIHDLVAKDQINIQIDQGLYVKESHRTIVRGKVCSVYLKVLGNMQNISSIEHIENLSVATMKMPALELAEAMLTNFEVVERLAS